MHENGIHYESINDAVRYWSKLLHAGLYSRRLRDLRQYFPDSQIHIVFAEDLARAPNQTVGRVVRFLNVQPNACDLATHTRRNQRQDKSKDRAITRRLRRSELGRLVKNHLPTSFRRVLQPVFKKRITLDLGWHPDIRQRVTQFLQRDARRFLAECDRSADFWRWAEASPRSGLYRTEEWKS